MGMMELPPPQLHAQPQGRALHVGDRVRFDGAVHTVAGLSGTAIRLVSQAGEAAVVLLAHLLATPGTELLEAPPAPRVPPFGLLDAVPGPVLERARLLEQHVLEVETGQPPGAMPETPPRPDYDPRWRSLAEREAAKAAELTAAGDPTSVKTISRLRRRYREQGLWGLVDQRAIRQPKPYGRADPRLVAVLATHLEAETDQSTGTRTRLHHRIQEALAAGYGPGAVPMPSRATFYRLVAALSAGRHTFGQATTRRSMANRPAAPFSPTVATRPGEQVQIDSSPLDVLAVYDDGMTGRVELTIAVDVATRTICAALLRPVATKAVDAALLLARILVPEPMRPGWAEALAMAHSRLPHQRLLSLDTRLQQAAAKPVIVPETITVDRSRVFLSEVFLRACQTLGISVQPARPRTPTDKSVVERTFESVNTLFCQHLCGYVGGDVTRRGADVQAAWTVAELQDLLDEWLVAGWQPRPHEGLRNPDLPGRVLSPNEAYAVLVARAGYLPVSLTGDDYLELLPVEWRQINDYGVQIDYRTYDCPDLDPYRRQHSGLDAKRGLWEVHYDPYDLSHVWVRNHHGPDGGWITAPWTHLPMVRQPFADFTWRHARRLAAASGLDDQDETTVATCCAALLLGRRPTGASPAAPAPPPRCPFDHSPRRRTRLRRAAPTTRTRARRPSARWCRSEPSTRWPTTDPVACHAPSPAIRRCGAPRIADHQGGLAPLRRRRPSPTSAAHCGPARAARPGRACRLPRAPLELPRAADHRRHADDPAGRGRRPAAGPAQPPPAQRPPRPDRHRPGRHRQDHRHQPAWQAPRARRAPPRPDRPRPPPGRLRDRPARSDPADAGRGVRSLSWPADQQAAEPGRDHQPGLRPALPAPRRLGPGGRAP